MKATVLRAFFKSGRTWRKMHNVSIKARNISAVRASVSDLGFDQARDVKNSGR